MATLGPECLTVRCPGCLGGLEVPLPFSFLTLILIPVAPTGFADEGVAEEEEEEEEEGMGYIGRGAAKSEEEGVVREDSEKGSKDMKPSSLRISVGSPEGDWAGEYTLPDGDPIGEGAYTPDGDDGPDPIDLGDAGEAGLIALPGLEWAGWG